MNKNDLAREYRKKYPNMPTLKLARIMYKENNLLFKDVEHCRSTLRVIEGKMGKKHLEHLGSKNECVIKEERLRNPYKLPESYQEKENHLFCQKAAIIFF